MDNANVRGSISYIRSRGLVQFLARIVSFAIVLAMIIALVYGDTFDNYLPILVIILSVAELAILFCNPNVKNTGLTVIFFIYTLLCHNGFVIAYFYDKNYINWRSSTSMAYVNNQYYPTAILIANIVMYVFVLFTEFYTARDRELDLWADFNISEDNNIDEGSKAADFIGIIVLLIGTFFLAYIIFTHGLFMGLYSNILEITSQIPLLSHSIILTSLAVALLISSGTKKGIHVGLCIYLADMLLHFSIGNRGEVLYAAVICFALYSLRFKTIKLRHILLAGLAVIIVIPLVRIVRNGEVNLYSFNPLTSFFDVLCEEGFQISSFTYIVQYIKAGHGHVWGMTYVNDFVDFIARRFGATSPWANTEQYVIKSIMPYSGMGFSMIAETYYNFTIVGSCIWYAFLARFMVGLDKRIANNQLTNGKRMFLSMLMVELINLTRNDASTLPVYLVYMILLLLAYNIIQSVITAKNRW